MARPAARKKAAPKATVTHMLTTPGSGCTSSRCFGHKNAPHIQSTTEAATQNNPWYQMPTGRNPNSSGLAFAQFHKS